MYVLDTVILCAASSLKSSHRLVQLYFMIFSICLLKNLAITYPSVTGFIGVLGSLVVRQMHAGLGGFHSLVRDLACESLSTYQVSVAPKIPESEMTKHT